MMKAASIPLARTEAAIAAAGALETHSVELLELVRLLRDEIEMAGEIPADFVKRIERLIMAEQAALADVMATVGGAASEGGPTQ